jgi:hypothetical protein
MPLQHLECRLRKIDERGVAIDTSLLPLLSC